MQARLARLDSDMPGCAWNTSMNVTAWSSAWDALKQVSSSLVLIQETKLPKARLKEDSPSMAKQGWRMVASAATIESTDLSGGVAILVCNHQDRWHRPGEEEVFPGRAAMLCVRLPGLGVVAVCSVYMACSSTPPRR